MILIGIDVGTTGLKAVALDGQGRLLRERAERYPTRLAGTGAEQDAQAWWDAACAALPQVVAGESVVAVAITSQAPTLAAIDADGQLQGPALTWVDRRAATEASEIERLAGADRNQADPFFGTAKLLWWSRHRGNLDAASAVLAANGFLVHRLTGRSTLDESTAGMLQAWDGGFPPELAAAGVPVDLLPAAIPCATVAGTVTDNAAAATGLPAGTPVAAGGIDSVGAALEAGVFGPGDPTVEMTGFSTVTVQAVPRGTHAPGMIHTRHCFPDTELVLSAQNSTGSVVDWLQRLTSIDLSAQTCVPSHRPGRAMMVPSFAGERTPTWSTRARGALIGLDLDCDPADLLLALYEGTALALRDCLEQLERSLPAAPALRCIGGGANSGDWLQIKADVLGRPVDVPELGHGASVGAGLLAGLAVGHFSSADELRARAAASRGTYQPDASLHAPYTDRLHMFRRLRADLEPYNTELVADEPKGDHS